MRIAARQQGTPEPQAPWRPARLFSKQFTISRNTGRTAPQMTGEYLIEAHPKESI